MQELFGGLARSILSEGVAMAMARGNPSVDYRDRLCRWEDRLFGEYPDGHKFFSYDEALHVIERIFSVFGRPVPSLRLVPGFDDPRVGGYADVARNCISIERGYLYRFLVLHECAHLLVPTDRNHGPGFTYVLQILYRRLIGIPEDAIARLLREFELPSYTSLPVDPGSLALAG